MCRHALLGALTPIFSLGSEPIFCLSVGEYWKRRGDVRILLQDLRRPNQPGRCVCVCVCEILLRANVQCSPVRLVLTICCRSFVVLDPSKSLNEALAGTRVLAYPTLYVALPEEVSSCSGAVESTHRRFS